MRSLWIWISTKILFFNIFFSFPDYRDYDGSIKNITFSIQFSSSNVKFSFEISLEEVKPLIIEKNEFEHR